MSNSSRIVLVAALAVVAFGCGKASKLVEPPDAGAADVLGRYWLRDAALLDAPGGTEHRRVVGPVQVELLAEGRVRSLADARDRFAGYLPADILKTPRSGRGLMLYAQREAELRRDAANGPVVGKVYPGALLAVLPGEGEHARVAHGFDESQPWEGFVQRSALGSDPGTAKPPKRSGAGRVLVLPRPVQLLGAGAAGKLVLRSCMPIWFPEVGEPVQWIGGVELSGPVDIDPKLIEHPRPFENASWCAATVVTRHAGRLFEVLPDGTEAEVAAIPDHLRGVAPPSPDPVLRAMNRQETIFLLSIDHPHLACAEATFEGMTPRIRSGRLGAEGRLRLEEPFDVTYDFVYEPPGMLDAQAQPQPVRRPATVTLERHVSGERAFDSKYSVLAADEDAVFLMRLSTREGAVAFDPGQAERWFLKREACVAARDAATKALTAHPQAVADAGFHVPVPAGE